MRGPGHATSPGEGAERNSIKKVHLRPCVLDPPLVFAIMSTDKSAFSNSSVAVLLNAEDHKQWVIVQ